MIKATLSQLKDRLSAYLRMVRAGETDLIYDRGRPVASIERTSALHDSDERVARLEAAGLIQRPARAVPLKVLAADPPRSKRSVLAALLEERAGK